MSNVSVVISTYTEKRLPDVLRCISSLQKQTVLPKEIILVFDPCDQLEKIFEKFIPKSVKIIKSSKNGLSHARNTGIKNAVGEIVAFIDDDAYADKRWIENLEANYQEPNTMGVGGKIKPIWSSQRPIWFPSELDWIIGCTYKGFHECRSPVRNPIGANMSFRKSIFDEIGYFSSIFGRIGKILISSEETELCIRLYKKIPNSKIIYDPSAIVYHKVPKIRESIKYIWKRSFFEGMSKALVNTRFHGKADLSREDNYLKYLLRTAIPSRVRSKNIFSNLLETFSLFLSTSAVFAGYIVTNLGDQ